MDKTTEYALIAAGLYVGWKVVQAQRDISNFAANANPLLRDVSGAARDVRNITSSFAGISNAAQAIGNGLRNAFGLSNSGPLAPTQPNYAQNSFQSGGSFFGGASGGMFSQNNAISDAAAGLQWGGQTFFDGGDFQ